MIHPDRLKMMGGSAQADPAEKSLPSIAPGSETSHDISQFQQFAGASSYNPSHRVSGSIHPHGALPAYSFNSYTGVVPLSNAQEHTRQDHGSSQFHHSLVYHGRSPNAPSIAMPPVSDLQSSEQCIQSPPYQSASNFPTNPIIASQESTEFQSNVPWCMFKTADGKEYFYNSVTQVTQWDRPAEFQAKSWLSPSADSESEWITYTTAEGRDYYYNVKSAKTVWEKPEALVKDESSSPVEPTTVIAPFDFLDPPKSSTPNSAGISNSIGLAAESPIEDVSEQAGIISVPSEVSAGPFITDNHSVEEKSAVLPDPLQVTAFQPTELLQFRTKAAAVESFKRLLDDSGCSSAMSWEQVLPKIIHDKRYRALSTMTDRKAAFKDWVTEAAVRENIADRARIEKAQVDFSNLLAENREMIRPSMRYVEIVPVIRHDPRYSRLESSRTREDLFYEFIDMVEERELTAKLKAKMANEAEFRRDLESMHELNGRSSWREHIDALQQFSSFKQLPDTGDALKIFESVVSALRRAEQQKLFLEKESLREAERFRRASFRELLLEKMTTCELHLRTRWKSFVDLIKGDPRYLAMEDDVKISAMTLFDDFCDELEDRLMPSRKILRDVLALRPDVTISDTVDSLFNQLQNHLSLKDIPAVHLRSLLAELIDQAESRAIRETRRTEKYSVLFTKLLAKKVVYRISWELAQPMLESHSAFKKLDDSVRFSLFVTHINTLPCQNGSMLSKKGDSSGTSTGVSTTTLVVDADIEESDGEIFDDDSSAKVKAHQSVNGSRPRRGSRQSCSPDRRSSRSIPGSYSKKISERKRLRRSRSISPRGVRERVGRASSIRRR